MLFANNHRNREITPQPRVEKSVYVDDISAHLKALSMQKSIPYVYLDFQIIDTQTYLRENNQIIDYGQLQESARHNSSIAQRYCIQVSESKKRKFIINSKIYVSKSRTTAWMNISKESKIPYNEELEDNLTQYINKEKAKFNILIDIDEGSLREDVQILVELLRENKYLEEDFKIQIAHTNSYRASKKGYIKFLYLDEKFYNDLNRCFVYVQENQPIVELFLGDQGERGYDCRGELKRPAPVILLNTANWNMDLDSIYEEDGLEKTLCKARFSGVLTYDGAIFTIRKQFNVNALDFRTCAFFDAPLDDEEVVLNVRSLQRGEEAVGGGVEIRVHSITVIGDVARAKIIANRVQVSGVIQKGADITAQKVYANICKGKIEGDYIEVQSAENGLLQGGEVHLKDAIGARVFAKNIFIKRMYNYCMLKASHRIEITSLFGRFNEIFLTAEADIEVKDEIIELLQEIRDFKIKYPLSQMNKIKKRYNLVLQKAKLVTQKIKQLTQSNEETIAFKAMLYKMKKQLTHMQEVLQIEASSQEAVRTLHYYDDLIGEAEVVLHDSWRKHNFIAFCLVSSGQRMTFEPIGKHDRICLNGTDLNDTVLMR